MGPVFSHLAVAALAFLGCFLIYTMIERACPRCRSRATVKGNSVCYCYNCDLTWEPNSRCWTQS
jgi:hypothetical protein